MKPSHPDFHLPAPTSKPVGNPGWLRRILALCLGLGLMAPAPLLAQSGPVVRSGPSYYRPGIALTLTNTAAPLADTFLQTVEQTVPTGWSVGAASHDGRHQAAANKVSWGPFFDGLTRKLTVVLTPPSDATGRISLSGSASFDGSPATPTGLAYLNPAPAPTGRVTRSLPTYYLPGQTLTITNVITLEPGVDAYAVEETLPEGWVLIDANESGAILPQSTRLRWGPFLDGIPRNLWATVRVPDTTSGTVPFDGNGSFGAAIVAIGGASSVAQGGLGSGTVRRYLPSAYVPGNSVIITNRVTPGTGTGLVLIEESPPAGWDVTAISHFGIYDSSQGLVKWGPFMDETSRILVYTITPPDAAEGEVVFAGRGTFDQATITTVGATRFSRLLADSGTVLRSLPSCEFPGDTFSVTNRITPEADVAAYGVVENIPTGWLVTNPGTGNWDTNLHRVTWGPFFDSQSRTLIYEVQAPEGDRSKGSFEGYATFGENTVTNTGPAELTACLVGQGSAEHATLTHFIPGTQLPVTVFTYPLAGVESYLVAELIPAGWTVDSVSDFGTYDAANRTIKWGPFLDDLSRAISYRMTASVEAGAGVVFSGTIYFDGNPVAIGGTRAIPRNLPPTLTSIPSLDTPEDTPLIIMFSAADEETPASDLFLRFTCDNPALFPTVTLGTSGDNRTLTLVAATNASGFANASLILSDGTSSVTNSFSVAVSALNDPPWLQVPTPYTVWQGTAPFMVSGLDGGDPDAGTGRMRLYLTNALGSLTVTNLGTATVISGTNGNGFVGLEGDLATLRMALGSVQLEYPASFSGAAQLDVSLEDLGNTGMGGELFAVGIVPVNVLSVIEPIHAIADLAERPAGRSLKIRTSKLLANDVDIEGRTLTLLGVSAASAHGATVSIDGNWVIYQPPLGFDSTDSFTYTVSNGAGDSATGTVTIVIQGDSSAPTGNILSLTYLSATGFKLVRFQGIPGRTYRIQATDSLSPADWTTLALVTSGANGVYEFTDGDITRTNRYYRSLWP